MDHPPTEPMPALPPVPAPRVDRTPMVIAAIAFLTLLAVVVALGIWFGRSMS